MQKLLLMLALNINSGLPNHHSTVADTTVSCEAAITEFEELFLHETRIFDADESSGSPCSAESIATAQSLTKFFTTTGYDEGFKKLINANVPGVGTEFATVFGINYATGIPTALPMITTLSENSVTINASPANMMITAIAHTHHENVFPAPSAGDFYAFGNYAQSHPGFLYYILAANGCKYVLTVSNQDSLTSFLKSYPQKDNIEPDNKGNAGRGAGYNPGSVLYLAMQKFAYDILSKSADPNNPTATELDIAHEAVQVYILDHFNTGITLFKQEPNGSFHELHYGKDALSENNKLIVCK